MNPFYAKVMLFGEYSLMDGSAALTLPYRKKRSLLTMGVDDARKTVQQKASNSQLYVFHQYLQELDHQGAFSGVMHLESMKADLAGGLWLQSDIPTGYGLGSSGSLVAAVFDRYALPEWKNRPLTDGDLPGQLIAIFALMESFFHGSSSGIDPLCSYINKAILSKVEKAGVSVISMRSALHAEGSGFFLLDTGLQRQTAPLVSLYHQKKKDAAFSSMLKSRYIPCVNSCIEATTGSHPSGLDQQMRELSGLQFTYFSEMIPGGFLEAWERGFTSGSYSLKLCGAGGGGYILGYTRNFSQASAQLSQLAITIPEKL